MKNAIKLLFIICTLSLSLMHQATIMVYPFDNVVDEERFNRLIKELRCPKCQNNNLADSNSALAIDLKDIIYEQIKAGKTDDEITFYLKERYGDFISYRPPLKPSTWIIWFGPFVVLLMGGFFIIRFVSVSKNKNKVIQEKNTADVPQVDNLLNEWIDEDKSTPDNQQSPSKFKTTDIHSDDKGQSL